MAFSLTELSDRAEIADLVHTYALHIRNREPEKVSALFTPEAVFEVRDADPLDPVSLKLRSRSEGVDRIVASVSGSTGGNRVFPAIHNLLVTLDGDRASATSLMIATICPGAKETLGEYHDRFERTEDGWRFSERLYTIYMSA